MVDVGDGTPVVLVPGIQGRWEWMRPTVSALAERCRVITFSLAGERGTTPVAACVPPFDRFVHQVDEALDGAGVARAAICGVSYGGLIALRYAAARPRRVTALVLVSAVGPAWRPDGRVSRYVRRPWLTAPAFFVTAPLQLRPEVKAAFPHPLARLRFMARHAARVVTAPMSPARMAERVRLASGIDFVADCRAVSVPTLVVTGEPALDRVVPVEQTREYLQLIPRSRAATLEGTGHIGLITKPGRFAEVVGGFVDACRKRRDRRGRRD